MTLEIRPLREDDRAAWRPLWDGYLAFYRKTLPEETTAFTFARLCAEREGLLGLFATAADGAAVGFAHVVVHPSTWATTSYFYLEDLFVAPAARGTGAAQALIEAVYARADALGAARVYWSTAQYNGRARSLYDQVARLSSSVNYER